MTSTLQPLAKSKLKLRAASKGLSSTELDKLINGLTQIKAATEQKASEKALAQKRAKLKKIKAMMADAGIDASELVGVKGKRGRKKGARTKAKVTVPPKYRLVIKGEEFLWTGRGRAPRVFQDYFDKGKSKESCLIK
ncbi:MAG: H-NS histone family protein [Pseudomonadota bacterium]